MAKRSVIFIAAAIAVLCVMLCGCGKGGVRLTAEEYKTQLEAAWKRYVSAEVTAASYLAEDAQINGNDMKLSLQTVMKYASKAEEQYKLKEQSLDEFEAMNPPEEYGELHKELRKAAKNEREYLKLQRALFAAKTDEELAAADGKITAYNSAHTSDGGLPQAYTNILIKLKKQ